MMIGWRTGFEIQTKTAEASASQQQTPTSDRRSAFVDLAILWAIPLVQAAINDSWVYSKIGYLDPWIYFGYGLNYADPTFLNDNYKISRLPWVLTEFVTRHIFDGIVASWVLEFSTLALASASLYLLFARTLGRAPAFIATAVFAAFPFAHANAGVDYHNTLAGPLYCLTWWLAIRAVDLGLAPKRLFLVGTTAAATIHSDIVFASLMPVLGLHFLWAQWDKHKKLPSLLPIAIWPILGAIAITLVLGIINRIVGRDFLFFMPQFRLASTFVAHPANQKLFWHAWSTGWFWTAHYLGPFAAALLFASVTSIAGKIRGHTQVVMYSACYVLAAGLWIFWQSVGQTALDWGYFAYPLVFPLVGAIAAVFAFWASRPSLNIFAKLAISAILIGVLATFHGILDRLAVLPQIPFANSSLFGLIFCLLIFFAAKSIRFWAGIVALWLCIGFGSPGPGDYAPSNCPLARVLNRAIDQGHRIVRAELRANGLPFSQVYFWADINENVIFTRCSSSSEINLSYFERSLAVSGFSFLEAPWSASRLEDIDQQRLKATLTAGGLVVFITGNAERVDELMARYSELGDQPRERRLVIIDAEMTRITAYMFWVGKH